MNVDLTVAVEEPYVAAAQRLYKLYVSRSRKHKAGSPLRQLIDRWYELAEEKLALANDIPSKRREAQTTDKQETFMHLAKLLIRQEARFAEIDGELGPVSDELNTALPQFRW